MLFRREEEWKKITHESIQRTLAAVSDDASGQEPVESDPERKGKCILVPCSCWTMAF